MSDPMKLEGTSYSQVQFSQNVDKKTTKGVEEIDTKKTEGTDKKVKETASKTKKDADSSVDFRTRCYNVLSTIGDGLAWLPKKIYQFFMWLLWPCYRPSNMFDRVAQYPDRTKADFGSYPGYYTGCVIDNLVDSPEASAKGMVNLLKAVAKADNTGLQTYLKAFKDIYVALMLEKPELIQVSKMFVELTEKLEKATAKKDDKEIKRLNKVIAKFEKTHKKDLEEIATRMQAAFPGQGSIQGIDPSKFDPNFDQYFLAIINTDVIDMKALKEMFAAYNKENEQAFKDHPVLRDAVLHFERMAIELIKKPGTPLVFTKALLLELANPYTLYELATARNTLIYAGKYIKENGGLEEVLNGFMDKAQEIFGSVQDRAQERLSRLRGQRGEAFVKGGQSRNQMSLAQLRKLAAMPDEALKQLDLNSEVMEQVKNFRAHSTQASTDIFEEQSDGKVVQQVAGSDVKTQD